ncbi:hypothetical protein [Variovorax sp. RA8]|uniref:hypothetical protein n=1 Tax=Variovorax sp. (strain JCM 16519 / RA8) TaxID=662548 RepID=UPI0013A5601A|nr:hypothetical protein [Variovorax sp. RA8]
MSSYEEFAWRDAGELAMMAAADFKMSAARDQFEAMSAEQKIRIEDACRSMIEDFLRRTDSQRPAVLRKIAKAAGDEAAAMFAVFAIVALVRVREVLELRDRYMYALAPGSGNRETCAAIYAFQQEVIEASGIEWPDDAFDDIDLDEEEYDDEDGDPRRSTQVTEAGAERVVVKLEKMVAEQARRAREAVEVVREPLFAVHASPSKVFCLDPAGRLVRGTNEKLRPLCHSPIGQSGSLKIWKLNLPWSESPT